MGINAPKGKWYDPSKVGGEADPSDVQQFAYGKCDTMPAAWESVDTLAAAAVSATASAETSPWKLALHELIKMHTDYKTIKTGGKNLMRVWQALQLQQKSLTTMKDWRAWFKTGVDDPQSELALSKTAGLKDTSRSRFIFTATLPDFNIKQAVCMIGHVDPGFTISGAAATNNARCSFWRRFVLAQICLGEGRGRDRTFAGLKPAKV
jgi:hypothetical protein